MPYITSDVSMKVRSLILDGFVHHAETINHFFIDVGQSLDTFKKYWYLLTTNGNPLFNLIWSHQENALPLPSFNLHGGCNWQAISWFQGSVHRLRISDVRTKAPQLLTNPPASCQKAGLDLSWAEHSLSSQHFHHYHPSWSWTWSLWHREVMLWGVGTNVNFVFTTQI